MATFYDFNQVGFTEKRAGVGIKSITGKKAQLCVIRLEPGEATAHSHLEEQIGLVLVGRVEIFAGDETRKLAPNEGYCIPGGVRHGFRPLDSEPVEYIEVFCPPKRENVT